MKKLSLFLIAFTMMLVSCKPEIEKPTVVTKSVGEVTETSAKVVGQVASDGGAEVTERGICWNTESEPTILDYRVKDAEGGLGSYDVVFTDLTPNTQYYVRAYATNEAGTSYGEDKTFTTLEVTPDEPENPEQPEVVAPVVTTAEVSEIALYSAVCGGEVTFEGNVAVTARGVCWSTTQNPTIEDSKTTDGSGIGSFTSSMTNLEHNTTYYVRAYATNEVGTAYGEEVSFKTLDKYVDLGLPSGLKWATCNIGASSPEEYGDYFAWGETTTKTEYTKENCPTYGLSISELESQGYIDGEGNLTPSHDAATANWGGSWRMPTKAECQELLDNCTWEWTQVNGVNGSKVTGPNGNSIFLPAAGHRLGSSLSNAGSLGIYWSSTPYDSNYISHACILYFNYVYEIVYDDSRRIGLPVRPIIE